MSDEDKEILNKIIKLLKLKIKEDVSVLFPGIKFQNSNQKPCTCNLKNISKETIEKLDAYIPDEILDKLIVSFRKKKNKEKIISMLMED